MTLPLDVQKVVAQMYEKFGSMNHQGDEMRRKWTRMVCEQLVYTFGVGSGWGHKASSPTNPPSKDGIAQQQGDGKLFGWDIIAGGTFELIKEGLFHDITGQHFIQVPPVNHLTGAEPPAPPAPPSGCKCQDELGRVVGELKRMQAILTEQTVAFGMLARTVAELEGKVDAPRKVVGKVNARFLSGGSIEAEIK